MLVITQSLSHVQFFVTTWTAARQASLSFISQSLLKLMSIEAVMPSNYLILCCPFSFCPQSFPASGSFPVSQLFTSDDQNSGASVSATVLPTSIQSWFPLRLTVLVSLLSKEFSGVFLSTRGQRLWCSAFFTVQLSQLYMTTGKTAALTMWTFVGRVIGFWKHCLGLSQFSCREAIVFCFHGCVTVFHSLHPHQEALRFLPSEWYHPHI